MGMFFVHTSEGHLATHRQLLDAGIMSEHEALPPRPWLRAHGSGDATTLWHAVMRKQERGIWLATLVMRRSDHHERLTRDGWEEIGPEAIGVEIGEGRAPAPSPWSAEAGD